MPMKQRSDTLSVLQSLLPDGKLVGREFIARNPTRADNKPGSFKYNVDTGVWKDFSTDDSGKGIASYMAYIEGISYDEAKKKLSGKTPAGNNVVAFVIPTSYAPAPLNEGERVEIYAPTKEKWETKTIAKCYNYFHDGKCWAAVQRVEATDTRAKQFFPMRWGKMGDKEGWFFGTVEKRHFYNIDRVEKARVIMIVSGEKCVDALQPIYNSMAVVTWMGGDKALDKTPVPDVFQGKKIILWPDADESSMAAMETLIKKIQERWSDIDVSIVDTQGFAAKWDCADAIAEGMTRERLEGLLRTRIISRRPEVSSPSGAQPPVKAAAVGEDYTLLKAIPAEEWVLGTTAINLDGQVRHLRATSVQNAANFLCNMTYNGQRVGDIIAYNIFEDKIFFINEPPWRTMKEFSPGEFVDADIMDIRMWLERKGFNLKKNDIYDLIINIARRNTINPPRNYFESLVWDKTPRLGTWLKTYLGAHKEPEQYLSAVGTKWMVGAVNRIYEPGCQMDYCLIFEGLQGLGKSTLFRVLAEFGGKSYFTDMPVNFTDKDTLLGCQGKIIIEMAELTALRKGDMNEAKHWITRWVDHYRPPYGRGVVERKRMFVVAGTDNPTGMGMFADPTGNRRFWPVECAGSRIDIEEIRAVREQLWAEAVHLYKSGVRPKLTDEEEELAKFEQFNRRQIDVLEDELQNSIASIVKAKHIADGFSMNDIMAAMMVAPERRSPGLMSRLNTALRVTGYTMVYKRQADGSRKNLWYKNTENSALIDYVVQADKSEIMKIGQTEPDDDTYIPYD